MTQERRIQLVQKVPPVIYSFVILEVLFGKNTFLLAQGKSMPKVKIPRTGPVLIAVRISINCKIVPSLSIRKISSTLITPKTTAMIFIWVLALSSDVCTCWNGSITSLYTIPESVFTYEDNVLKPKCKTKGSKMSMGKYNLP